MVDYNHTRIHARLTHSHGHAWTYSTAIRMIAIRMRHPRYHDEHHRFGFLTRFLCFGYARLITIL